MKKLSIALILALALALPGCSMLREEAAPAEFFGSPKNPRLKDFLGKVL